MHISSFIRAAWLVLAVLSTVRPLHAGDTLVQVSTIDALIKGIYDGPVSVGEIMKNGDFAIGTLEHLDGEMLALDGKVFQITSDGKVHDVPAAAITPFAVVTSFGSDKTQRLENIPSLEQLQAAINLSSENLFYAIRITGTFSSIKLRSVPRQAPPYPVLPEVVKKQAIFEHRDIKGTLVGFHCPPYVKGINVPGYHFHFISDDRQAGGHLLDCSLAVGEVAVDILENFKLLVPEDQEFLKADFSTHDAAAVNTVEKAAK